MAGSRRSKARRVPRLSAAITPKAIAATISALALAGLAGAQAVVQVAQGRSPRTALEIYPNSAVALATSAERLWLADPKSPATRARVAALARRSVEAMPFNPMALRLLGFTADAEGQGTRARALLTLSERMTRRDVKTQLWLVEDNARAGRLDQTLVHYDTALRTNAGAGAILYPILGSAVSDPDIQRALAPYLRQEAPWIVPFVRASIESNTELGPLSHMLATYGQVPARSLQTQLLNALVTAGSYEDAARYFRSIPGAKAEVLQDVAFDAPNTDPALTPIAWQPLASGTATAALESGGPTGRRYHVAIAPDEHAAVLHKILTLAPGRYLLGISQSISARGPGGAIGWRLACLAAPSAPQPVLDLADTGGRTSAAFTVPAACRAQELTLSVTSGPGDAGLDFYVDRVTVTRSDAGQASAPQ